MVVKGKCADGKYFEYYVAHDLGKKSVLLLLMVKVKRFTGEVILKFLLTFSGLFPSPKCCVLFIFI